jgi:hypothetical protein
MRAPYTPAWRCDLKSNKSENWLDNSISAFAEKCERNAAKSWQELGLGRKTTAKVKTLTCPSGATSGFRNQAAVVVI